MKNELIQYEEITNTSGGGNLIIVMGVSFFWRLTILAYVGDALLKVSPMEVC